ncbi:MAG: Crp/Fnr family transcriptional regulator [Salibacteraceae bacterium]
MPQLIFGAMLEALFEQLEAYAPLDDSDRQLLGAVVRSKVFQRGDYLLRAGAISKSFFFVVSGFVRLYYDRDSGEKTAYFYQERQFVSAYESYMHQSPCRFNLQAIESCQVLEFTQEAASHLLNHSSKFEKLARLALENELLINQRIIGSLLALNPVERYLHLLDENPQVFQRVPQHYIASYIGVVPETLSRIKKRALSQKS